MKLWTSISPPPISLCMGSQDIAFQSASGTIFSALGHLQPLISLSPYLLLPKMKGAPISRGGQSNSSSPNWTFWRLIQRWIVDDEEEEEAKKMGGDYL